MSLILEILLALFMFLVVLAAALTVAKLFEIYFLEDKRKR